MIFLQSRCRVKGNSAGGDDRCLSETCSCSSDIASVCVCVCVCVCVSAFITHCMSANTLCCSFIQIDSLVVSTLSICYNGRGPLFIIMWLFAIAYTVISEMDGSFGCCSESPSMTLHTVPVHTEPETTLPALSCSAVIHWRAVPPRVLYICSRNVLLVRITVKANLIVSYCTVHQTAVSHSPAPCCFMRS